MTTLEKERPALTPTTNRPWESVYRNKIVPVDEAVSRIESGFDVVVAQCASEPQACMSRFHAAADRVEDVRVFSVLTLKPYEFFAKPEMKGRFELASWFHAPGARAALSAGTGTVTYVPNMLHRAALDRIHARKPDIFFGTCTPPDRHGFVSLSLGITYEKDIIEAADTVVLEVNRNLPRTFGDTHLHVRDADLFVENDCEVPTLPQGAAVTLHRADCDHVVTEHGVAYMRGRTVRERTNNLIAVAHPDHRAGLKDQARKLGYL